MLIEVNVEDFHRDPNAVLDQVQLGNAEVVVTEGGKVIAALINPGLFERTRRMHDRFEEITAKITEDFREIPMEEGVAEIDAAVAWERGKK
jgi:antitoxin (DNA-binding transcriptional repressor) of toxin-antitoxin stability system